ncbi:MAG TPA: D-alanyl-D-alanine carboxypeptidase [Candidatus Onthoplasma faecigallinarum]|nr:D-alanyl-D-alanine carboxypeptidase [Candidatus Onthoplasma faecigallinarum]
MKRKVSIVLVLMLMFGLMLIPHKIITADASFESNVNYKSAVLIEKNSNEILFENNCHERLPIASVTKLMTILLTMEKIGSNEISLDDKVMVSATASGMGGSQVFLDYEEEYYLKDLLKSVIIASANDSSVAIAEHIAGSENNFVKMMNERAKELNLLDTNYVNCTGLPSPDGYSSAYDQAIVLKHVLDFDLYHEYSSIWMEDFVHPSGRTTQMANTNKLSRFYEGCMGGKTGSTNQAKYCLAVGASRNDVELISVVLGAEDSKGRFKLSSDLLNYGFENFETKTLFDNSMLKDKTIKIKGLDRVTHLKAERDFTYVCKIGEDVNFSLNYNLPNMLTKVYENQVVGNVEIVIDGVVVDKINILSTETHEEVTVWDYIKEITNS